MLQRVPERHDAAHQLKPRSGTPPAVRLTRRPHALGLHTVNVASAVEIFGTLTHGAAMFLAQPYEVLTRPQGFNRA